MSFARPELLVLALVLPLLAALGVWGYARRRRRVARALGSAGLLRRLGAGDLERFPAARLALIAAAAATVGFAAAGPRWGVDTAAGPTRSANVVVALDVSKSMLVEDVTPNRLEQQRLLVRRLIRELEGDRFGLVAFSGRAYVLSPLTSDRSALELYLDALDPEIVSQGGSSLASALEQAARLAIGRDPGRGERAVVLVSDGEALEERDEVIRAAEQAARMGVTVYTVGVGTPEGGRVPEIDPETGRRVGNVRGPEGEIVISRLDESLMRRIADETGGEYVRLGAAGSTSRLVSELRGLQRARRADANGSRQAERYAWFVALAIALIAADTLLFGTPRGVERVREREG